MKVRFLTGLFFFISFSQAISSSGLLSFANSEYKDLNLSESKEQSQEVFGKSPLALQKQAKMFTDSYKSINRTIDMHKLIEQRRNEGKYETSSDYSVKSQRGKAGAYGGANVVHRPTPAKNSSVTLLSSPGFWLLTAILFISFSLISVFPVHPFF
ncbi:Histone-lysine N-methyltransferase, H3 lysine-4 specific like [Quillaja saponaria]|uniref:Histone-lysine N-methyltransferase, H3 lysine-4 specific like n=1 Tax=Quillaja saponaria TaxID=32244 RepID=A0AAD7L615_QUISA|nr:Histone-lysine N-methyltransferase, H3 lysine-4 specific like [Quillaja saponaria]